MKYIVFKDKYNLEEEMKARKRYIYNTFTGVYRIEEKEYSNRIELVCFSILPIDIIVLIGHYNRVNQYILENEENIECDTLIIISCFVNKMKLKKLKKVKRIYASKTTNGETEILIGKDYGFDFKITKSELILYNTRKVEMNERIKKSFSYVQK